MEKWLNMIPNASEHGAGVDALLVYVHWLMLALFVGWSFYFLFVLFRFRSGASPKGDYHGTRTHITSWLEFLVAGIEVVLLVFISIPIWANQVGNFPKASEALTVRVVAEQFAWNFHYAGKDGIFGVTHAKFVDAASNPLGIDPNDANGKDDIHSMNQLVIPEGQAVITKILSKDVIHSFGVPALRVKQDAIPGQEIPIWFKAIKQGDFEIACSQLCGIGHYSMKGNVAVKSRADFDAWLAQEEASKASQGNTDSFWTN